MGAAVEYGGRMFVFGGRDRGAAFHCAFALPLPTHPASLLQFVAQYLRDHLLSYRNRGMGVGRGLSVFRMALAW